MVSKVRRSGIIAVVITIFTTIISVQGLKSQEIEIAKFALDDNELVSDRVDADKELLWSIAPEQGKMLFLIDKFQDSILYVEQTDIDNQEYRLIKSPYTDSSVKIDLNFDSPENVEIIKLTSNYIVSCEILDVVVTEEGDNYYKYLVKSFNLDDGKTEELFGGMCSTPLLVPNVYRDSSNIFIIGEDIDTEKISANIFIKVFDSELNLKNEFKKNNEDLSKLKNRERWFSRSAILEDDIFSDITLAFSTDEVPTFRQYSYDRVNGKFDETDCPDGFEIYDHKILSERYDLYTLINNRSLNDLTLELFDKQTSTYHKMKNLDKFWIMNLYPLSEDKYLVQYQNEWQRNHLGILSPDENDIENSQMKLLFKNDDDYEFQESLLNPIVEIAGEKIFLYGVNLKSKNLEAYSISVQ